MGLFDNGMFSGLDISISGMNAQRDQMDLIAENLANINTTHALAGGPYRRKMALLQERNDFDEFFVPAAFGFKDDISDDNHLLDNGNRGVEVAGVLEDPAPFKKVYDPHNPEADEHGYVSMPNVDLITEMTNMIQASRAYEANAVAADTAKEMYKIAIQIASLK